MVGLLPRGAEGGEITGRVLRDKDSTALADVIISIPGTEYTATSDSSGAYRIADVPPGRWTVTARRVGFRSSDSTINVLRTLMSPLEFYLRESPLPLEEVQVIGDRTRRQEDVRTSVLSVAPIRARTLPGVGEDVLRTLQALPGVFAPNDFSSQLVIRGSGPDQNLIIMDGIEVFNPYRLYGMISMFNPETVSDITLITGGFPARYGDRLSAVLDVTNKEGDRSRAVGGSVNASITNANIVLNGSTPFGVPGSYVIAGRRTFYDLILGPIAKSAKLVSGDVAFPNFADLQAKITLAPGTDHRIIFNAVKSTDGVAIVSGPERETPDSLSVQDATRNDILGASWHWVVSPDLLSEFSVSWYRNSGDSEFGGEFLDPSLNRDLFGGRADTAGVRLFDVSFDSRYVFRKTSLSERITWKRGQHTFEGGAGTDRIETTLLWHMRPDEAFRAILRARGVPVVEDFSSFSGRTRAHVYLQDRIAVGSAFVLQPGLRFDTYQVIRESYVSPRLAASYAPDPLTTIRAAWGIYRQSPGYEKLLDQNVFLDLTMATEHRLEAERALHYVAGIDRWMDHEWLLTVEAYLKRFSRLIVQEVRQGLIYESFPIPGADPLLRTGWTEPAARMGDSVTTLPVNEGRGTSYGLEFLLRKVTASDESRLSGWVSYAWSRATLTRNGITTPFRFDQRHAVNVVIDLRLSSWFSAGIRWKYGSNFPFTEPVGVTPRIVTTVVNGMEKKVVETDGRGRVIFDVDRGDDTHRYQASLPAYHRLDLRLTANAGYWGLDWDFYLDVINVYNHRNILSYSYYVNEDMTLGRTATSMIPILPTLGVSVRF